MKKLICLLLALLTVIACVPVLAEQESKALVLYFDYSENIDTTGLDVDAIRAMNRGEAGRYFNIDYQRMGGFFTTLNE